MRPCQQRQRVERSIASLLMTISSLSDMAVSSMITIEFTADSFAAIAFDGPDSYVGCTTRSSLGWQHGGSSTDAVKVHVVRMPSFVLAERDVRSSNRGALPSDLDVEGWIVRPMKKDTSFTRQRHHRHATEGGCEWWRIVAIGMQ